MITYKSFKARQASDIIFYPCLLKEYRNRWFILGITKISNEITTFALDRIQQIVPLPNEPFRQPKNFDPHTYFNNIIGVTRNTTDKPTHITFLTDHSQAPYIKTKPIHSSQQVIEERKDGIIFRIDVIPNFELERELIGFGEGLKILSPDSLIRRFRKRAKLMYEIYHGTTSTLP